MSATPLWLSAASPGSVWKVCLPHECVKCVRGASSRQKARGCCLTLICKGRQYGSLTCPAPLSAAHTSPCPPRWLCCSLNTSSRLPQAEMGGRRDTGCFDNEKKQRGGWAKGLINTSTGRKIILKPCVCFHIFSGSQLKWDPENFGRIVIAPSKTEFVCVKNKGCNKYFSRQTDYCLICIYVFWIQPPAKLWRKKRATRDIISESPKWLLFYWLAEILNSQKTETGRYWGIYFIKHNSVVTWIHFQPFQFYFA